MSNTPNEWNKDGSPALAGDAGSADREKRYNALLNLLMDAELAARNGQWMTCGTHAKRVTALAYQYGNEEPNVRDEPCAPREDSR